MTQMRFEGNQTILVWFVFAVMGLYFCRLFYAATIEGLVLDRRVGGLFPESCR